MNILFITTRYPRSYQEPIVSGVVKNPFSASVALARAGHAVTVITDGPHTGVWNFEGITVHGVGEGFLKGVMAAFFVDIKISLQFLRMRNERFDVVHIHSGNLLFFFLLKKMGFVRCPVVYTAHGTSTPELRANTAGSLSLHTILLRINGFVQEVIDRVMWSGSDMLVSASDYQIEEMKTLYGLPGEKIVRVYNGVDTARYFPNPQARKAKREELGLSQDARVVLFVGRMAPKKGVHLLVNALPSVLDKCPDAVFVCVSGNTGRYRGYRSQIEGLRAQVTAQDRFRIIDDVAEADMPDFYNSADVCVFPSLGYESLPTVIYEAMATGVPIITQGSWGTPEVLDEVLLSEEELQGEALPATIVELLNDASRREAISRSYQEKVGRFSWDVLEKEYEELYAGLCERAMKKGPHRIVLLDYYSEKNRGDAAIQVGLIRLVRAQFPEATISVVSAIGANQSRDLPEHFLHTRQEEVAVYGGLCPTTVSLQGSNRFLRVKAIRAFVAGGSFLLCVVLLVALALRVPATLIAACMPASFRKTIQVLAESDVVIWRGTNFRSGTSFLRDAYSTFFWCFQPLACLFMGKPVACVGVSLWLPRTFVARAIYRMAFRQCIFFAVREEESLDRVRAILGGRGPKPVLMPDLSFIFLKEVAGFSSSSTRDARVGVTIVDRHKGDSAGRARYTRVMRAIFNEILSGSDSSIVIIPQVTTRSEDASGIVEEILSDVPVRARARITIGAGERSIQELVAEYAGLDYLVATRLHSSVFALASGTPVFVVRYDEGPQWSILSMLGADSFVVDYRATDERDIVERFRSFRIDGAYPTSEILENFRTHYERIGEVFSQISSVYEQWARNKQ